MGDNERGWEELESHDARERCIAHVSGGEGLPGTLGTRLIDVAQYLHQERTGSHTGIQYPDTFIRQPVWTVELVAQCAINTINDVPDNLGRRVPNAQVAPEPWIELGEEGLIEILDGFLRLEGLKEGDPVDPIERVARPVQ